MPMSVTCCIKSLSAIFALYPQFWNVIADSDLNIILIIGLSCNYLEFLNLKDEFVWITTNIFCTILATLHLYVVVLHIINVDYV